MTDATPSPAAGNWGRWGAEDERGALNLITAAVTREAAAMVSSGRVLSLAQAISPRMPAPTHRPGVLHMLNRDGGDYAAGARRPGGFQFAEDTVVMPLHTGTHIDALCHCWYGDRMFNGFSGNAVRSGGSARLGAEMLGPIATRGVLLDFVALAGRPLADGETITPAMLDAALAASGTAIRPGDAVLLHTGWLEAQAGRAVPNYDAEPGLGLDAALALAEAGAAIVGADNFAVEVLPFPEGSVFPVHQCLIRDFGIPLLEGLVLSELAAAGQAAFLLVIGPLPVVGATGSPVTPVAVF